MYLLRKFIYDFKKRTWRITSVIRSVFDVDVDVDPEWSENLNSSYK